MKTSKPTAHVKYAFTSFIIASLLTVCQPLQAPAQGSRADYERAIGLRNITQNKVLNDRVRPHWFDGNSKFWYRSEPRADTDEFILVDAENSVRKHAFDHVKLADALEVATGEEVSPGALPIDDLEFEPGSARFIINGPAGAWKCNTNNYKLQKVSRKEPVPSSLPPEKRVLQTRHTGEETFITFTNQLEHTVKIFWITGSGQRRSYGSIPPGDRRRQHTFEGHVWLVTEPEGEPLAVFKAVEDERTAVIKDGIAPEQIDDREDTRRDGFISPNGGWRAFFRDYNLFIEETESGDVFQLSTNGTAEAQYSGRIRWSPDSQKLVSLRTRQGGDRKVYYIESSPNDRLQPKLHSYEYLKPGDRIPQPRPQLFHVDSRKKIPISDELFPNPWSITDIHWRPDSKGFFFLYNQRGHRVMRLIFINAETGETKSIIDEQPETYFDYAHKKFIRYLPDTDEVIWMSERDGWNHLYLYDTKIGRLKNQITKGHWVVRGMEQVDPDTRRIRFRLSGVHPAQDPYYIHYAEINLDGSDFTILTEGNGSHSIEFSPDKRFFIDSWSRVDKPPITVLRDSRDGRLVCRLKEADWSALIDTGWNPPIRFETKGRDDKTDIYGIIIRPRRFDPDKKYPVIEHIYAGPQGSFVPKSFRAYYKMQCLAELGFIVVQIDGMGTSNRSKKFHDVSWRNLGDAGFPDRIKWIKAAAKEYTYMDIDRVGIYGGSAGGQNAMRALIAHNDFYDVAVADCGCHDNRMDKIWWNELYMSWPVDDHYVKASNVEKAHKLKGDLLLIVGEMDENVDPASTMQVVDALIKAGKDFDMLVIPGQGHGAAETEYGNKRRMAYFVENLLNIETHWNPDTQ
ncbi:MAG: prolyl oligopeptidase family serine peptidase [Verrucomicrobia bacterium]|nr:prolyl oligopeptidase family serine peptidase [Verrucomicrobiota bacterium]